MRTIKTTKAVMTERELQIAVIDMVKILKGLVYHTYDSRRSHAGFPDLVIILPTDHRVLFVELKTNIGKVSLPQQVWLNALAFTRAEVYVWRPDDLTSGNIWAILQGNKSEQPTTSEK